MRGGLSPRAQPSGRVVTFVDARGTAVVTDAAVHDSRMFEAVLVRDNTSSEVWADSAYRSRESEGWL